MKGYHIILDLYGVDRDLLNNPEEITKLLKRICVEAGMKIIKGDYHKFSPLGITAFFILAESHISIHTWPEHNAAAIDIYYCGKKEQVIEAAKLTIKYFKPNKYREHFITRE